MKYDTIIFDFDGTISDSEGAITRGFQKGLAAFGVEETLENIKALIGPPLGKTIQTKYGFNPEDAVAAMTICKNFQISPEGLEVISLYDGMMELLQRLKELGLKLAIATNKPLPTVKPQMTHLGLDELFDALEANDVAQTRGSKSDFVRWAMEGCGSTPDRCLMVGDRKADVVGGKDSAMDTCGVLYGYGSREEMEGCTPTYIISTPLELLEVVKNS